MIYIPTQQQRQKVCKQLIKRNNQNVNNGNTPLLQVSKKISKFQEQKLIERLMKNTKKHYQIQASINKIQLANQKIHKLAKNQQKVQNRLLKQGEKIKLKKQNFAKQIQKQQKQNYSEIPKITKLGKEIVQKPIHSRVTQILEKKLINVKNLQEKYKPLFEPILNPYSQFIVEIDDEGDFFQRMIKNQEKVKQKLLEKKRCIQNQLLFENTKPSFVNKKSEIILAQKYQKKRSKSIVCDSVNKQKNQNQMIYHPKINRKSVQLVISKPQYNEGNCFNRLYSIQKVKNKEKIRKQMQKQLIFKPKINRRKQVVMSKKQQQYIEKDQELFQIFVKKQNQNHSGSSISEQSEQECPRFSNIVQQNNKQLNNLQNKVKFSKSQWSKITSTNEY